MVGRTMDECITVQWDEELRVPPLVTAGTHLGCMMDGHRIIDDGSVGKVSDAAELNAAPPIDMSVDEVLRGVR
jgi:hypothetical protein